MEGDEGAVGRAKAQLAGGDAVPSRFASISKSSDRESRLPRLLKSFGGDAFTSARTIPAITLVLSLRSAPMESLNRW